MNPQFQKLRDLLRELFQLDQPDLDFGLYRVMHAKAAEITAFLDRDLLPQVKAGFALYQSADKAALESELKKTVEQAQALGADPESLPKVKDLPRPAPGRSRRSACPRSRRLRPPLPLLLPLLLGRRLHLQTPLLRGRQIRHPLRRRRGQAPLGQRGPVLHQDQRIPPLLRLPAASGRRREPDACPL